MEQPVHSHTVRTLSGVHRSLSLAVLVGYVSASVGCDVSPPGPLAPEEEALETNDPAALPFAPLPTEMSLDPARVALGRKLFADRRLSGDGRRSCIDCHDLAAGGVSPNEPRSNHPLNDTGPYNVPTVYNVAFNFRYNWQGTFATLDDHLQGLMMSELVMNAGSWEQLAARLAPHYDAEFRAAGFEAGVSEAAIREVLTSYERSLVTPNSPFDRYLEGDEDALDDAARRGLALFVSVGCASCHQGINIGGNLFQRFGVMEDAFGGRELRATDYGRMMLTGRPEDAHVFRVPSLRNVALTAPYFHDGSAETLPEAVRHMARVQLSCGLEDAEVDDLVAFLESLTGERPR